MGGCLGVAMLCDVMAWAGRVQVRGVRRVRVRVSNATDGGRGRG